MSVINFLTLVSNVRTKLVSNAATVDFLSIKLGASALEITADATSFGFGSKILSGVATPVASTDAATKGYVDTNFIASSLLGANSGVATLTASGKLSSSQVPAIAITDTFVVVDQAAMLALSTAETGDVAVRTDVNKSFILAGTTFSTLADWQELLSPTDQVQSVNGLTGTVVLDTDDVSEGSTNLYFTDARAKSAAVADSITDGVTDVAPSQNAVFDALALKADDSVVVKSVNGVDPTAGAVTIDTDDVSEGSTNLYFTSGRAKSAAVADSITDGVADVAPSQNAVFDALALKADLSALTSAGSFNFVNDNAGTINAGQVVYVKSNGAVDLAIASLGAGLNVKLAIVADATIATTATGSFKVAAGSVVSGYTGLTPGGKVYVSRDTAGSLTQSLTGFVATEAVVCVGKALSATVIEFNPEFEFVM